MKTSGMGAMDSFRRTGFFGGGAGFGPSSHMANVLGQGTPVAAPVAPSTVSSDWYPRAKVAASEWDGLLTRVGGVKNEDAQASLEAWIGKGDIPGSNAERYLVVTHDMALPASADAAIALRRVEQLEGAVASLSALVDDAEKKYGVIGKEALVSPAFGTPQTIGLALLIAGLMIAVPLMLKD